MQQNFRMSSVTPTELAQLVRPLTEEEALESFQKLQAYTCEMLKGKQGAHLRAGLDCLDYSFLVHRLKAKTKRHISFAEAVKKRSILQELDDKIRQIKKLEPREMTRSDLFRYRYDVFQLYYGTINQFRPTEVVRLLCKLKPTKGVLDFSAGWGGRCLGTMAYGLPYYGVDANTNLQSAYTKLIQMVNPTQKVQMTFKPAETVDFSKFTYDLIFTSPPYFMLEEYEKMPEYGSEQGFLETFFQPTVENAWKHLLPGGHMALNMPKKMFDAVKHLLPPVWKRFQLPVKNRYASNAASGRQPGASGASALSETIYVWKKQLGKKTRKQKKY